MRISEEVQKSIEMAMMGEPELSAFRGFTVSNGLNSIASGSMGEDPVTTMLFVGLKLSSSKLAQADKPHIDERIRLLKDLRKSVSNDIAMLEMIKVTSAAHEKGE